MIVVRKAELEDIHELRNILNEIIEIGGTTAMEAQLSVDEFADHFLLGEDHLCCFVAVDEVGALAGFQSLARRAKLPDGWGDIATFARPNPKIAGVGSALFAATRQHAQEVGVIAINATIRADNEGGLAFYDKVGFKTYSVNEGAPLADGTLVDRISKRFDLQ